MNKQLNKYLVFLVASVLILGLMIILVVADNSKSKLGNLIIKNNSQWVIEHSTDSDLFFYSGDKNKQKTTICLLSKTATKTNDLSDKELYKDSKLSGTTKQKQTDIKPTQIQSKDSKLDKDYYGYCYTITDDSKYLKFGENSTVIVYQDIKSLEYQTSWSNSNITLYELVNGSYNNSINDIWVFNNENSEKFGANKTGVNSSYLNHFKYILTSDAPLQRDVYSYYVEKKSFWNMFNNQVERHYFNFQDICLRTFNCTNKTINNKTSLSCMPANCVFNLTNPYNLEVTFLSDRNIDPTITLAGDTTYNATLTNVTQEIGYAHLNLSDPSIVLYMPFDSDTGIITRDYSPFDNDGTCGAVSIASSCPGTHSACSTYGSEPPCSDHGCTPSNSCQGTHDACTTYTASGQGTCETHVCSWIPYQGAYCDDGACNGNPTACVDTTGTCTGNSGGCTAWDDCAGCTISNDCFVCGGGWTANGCASTWHDEVQASCFDAGGQPHACQQSECDVSSDGCYNAFSSCGGTEHPCSTWDADQSTCDTHGEGCGLWIAGASGICPSFETGKYGECFKSLDNYIAFAYSPSLNFTKNFTISLWIKSNTGMDGNNLISYSEDDVLTGGDWYIMFKNTLTIGGIGDGNERDTGISFTDGAWHLLTLTKNSTNYTLYKDGTPVYSIAHDNSVTYSGSPTLNIAKKLNVASYIGSVDEVMIYNKTLNSSEVSDLYNNQSSRVLKTGNMFFTNINFTGSTTNISLANCTTLQNSNLSIQINNGNVVNLTNCQILNYDIPAPTDNANLTIFFTSDPFGFYSPTVVGNISLDYIEGGDIIAPNATLLTPGNLTFTLNLSQNFTANLTDNTGIKNASLYIDGVFKSATSFIAGTINTVIGTVQTLIGGFHTWYYIIFDWAGNSFTTNNNTITTLAFTSGYPYANNSYYVNSFINVSGNNFTLAGNPYRMIGVDAYYLIDYATNNTYDDVGNKINNSREAVIELLNEAKYLGINDIRVWALMVGGNTTANSTDWAQNNSGGHYNFFLNGNITNYNETMYQAMDFVVAESSKRDIRLEVVFVNNWQAYGGMSWWVQQASTTSKVGDDPSGASYGTDSFHDQFYNNSEVMLAFQKFMNYTIMRNNTITGKLYRDDPTIFAWLLTNEARAKSDPQGNNNLIKNWTKNMTSFIKSIDSNHLVSLGIEGLGYNETWGEGTDMIKVHNGTGVDFVTFELHPKQWDYFAQRSENATNGAWVNGTIDLTIPESKLNATIDWWTTGSGASYNNRYTGSNIPAYVPKLARHGYQNWVSQNVNWSNQLNMPVIMQEIAYPSNANYSQSTRFFQQSIHSFFSNGGDGYLFWNFNHDGYYYSTAGSSCYRADTGVTGAGCMDDGYSFYLSDDPTLKNKSKSIIDAFSFVKTDNSGGSWVTPLNNYKYNFVLNIALPNTITLDNCSLWINKSNGTWSGWTLDQNTTSVLDSVDYTFSKQFDSTDEEFYWYTQCCANNGTSLCTNSTSTYILLQTEIPVLTLISPNGNFFNNETVNFYYSIADTLDISSCELYINGVLDKVDTTVTTDITQTFSSTLPSVTDTYNWSVKCTDIADNVGISTTNNFTVDIVFPTITFIQPVNNSYLNNRTIYFATNYTEDIALKNTTLYIWNSSNSAVINSTENRTITGTSNSTNISVVLPYDGTFKWNYYACDNLSNCGWNSTNYTVTADTRKPGYNSLTPSNGTITNNLTITFNAILTDNIGVLRTSFQISNSSGGTIVNTDNPASYSYNANCTGYTGRFWYLGNTTSEVTNITCIMPKDGVYSWIHIIYDQTLNWNISSTRYITVDTTPPYFTGLSNQTIRDNESLSYDINASDSGVGISKFAINWTTNFSIDEDTGLLTNSTNLSVDIYWINVSINDTLGNLNSSIFFVNVSNISLTSTPIPTGSITYSNPTTYNFSIELIPHYYYNSKEILVYSEDQEFDGISFDIEIDTQNKIDNLKIYDAEPSIFKNNLEITNSSSESKRIIGQSKIMSVSSFSNNQTFFIGISGTDLNSQEINVEYSYNMKFKKNLLTFSAIGNVIYKGNYILGLVILGGVIGIIVFLIYKQKRRRTY